MTVSTALPTVPLAALLLLVVPMHGAAQDWTPDRRADGQPNISGMWDNTRALFTPVELPEELAGHTLSADAVIVAAGSWSGGIPMSPALSPPVRPVRGQLLQLRFSEPPLSHVIWGASVYLVPWEDGRVLVGATVEDVGFDARVTVAGVRQLLDVAEALVPMTASAVLDGARAGLRPATPDQLPIIGPSSTMPGVYFATGHYRSGVLLAPLTASMMADLVLDGRESAELALVRPDRSRR